MCNGSKKKYPMRRRYPNHALSAILIALVLIAFATADAGGADWAVKPAVVTAGLVAAAPSVHPGQPFVVALHLRMEPDWHVYWRNPGDSGLPTDIQWELPQGFTAGRIAWPIPEKIETQGLVSYGYSGEIYLPVQIVPPASLPLGRTVTLRARASWLACRIECIPGSAMLSLSLPVTAAPDSAGNAEAGTSAAQSIASAYARVPRRDPSIVYEARADDRSITLLARNLKVPSAGSAAFYPYSAGSIRDIAPQVIVPDPAGLSLRISRAAGSVLADRLSGVLVVSDSQSTRGIEVDVPIAGAAGTAPGTGAPQGGAAGLLIVLALAFAGGILLNLMPCVLPVVSLKVMSLLRTTGDGRKSGLRHGLLFTAGVLAAFWAVAGMLLALRAAGQLIGWGFQFQEPAIVAATASLFLLIALNLFGVFPIGVSLTRLGGRHSSGNAAAFLSGVFAVVVATPCTAPFMASAVGYALSRPAPVALGIFSALGLGMAAPFLLLSAAPGLLPRLPKPGPWMETLRQILGFPMLAAVVWMLFVLAGLAGASAVIAALAGLLLAGMGAWVWGRWGALARPRRVRIAAGAIALALVLGGSGFAALSARGAAGSVAVASGAAGGEIAPARPSGAWQPWSPALVERLRAEGVPVFIDFTARWCLSCQVNEQIALRNAGVERRFRELGVATLVADWTDRNDDIARALGSYGRAGVPLYVLYQPGAADPRFLPELLTPGIVIAALGSGVAGP
jgi:thiol:disulfide interchange protein